MKVLIEDTEYQEATVIVKSEWFSPGDKGCHTLPNGDPGHPPEPADVDDVSVYIRLSSGNIIDITDLMPDSDMDQVKADLLAQHIEKLNSEEQCELK